VYGNLSRFKLQG